MLSSETLTAFWKIERLVMERERKYKKINRIIFMFVLQWEKGCEINVQVYILQFRRFIGIRHYFIWSYWCVNKEILLSAMIIMCFHK